MLESTIKKLERATSKIESMRIKINKMERDMELLGEENRILVAKCNDLSQEAASLRNRIEKISDLVR
jgi:phage shock protein A